MEKSVQQEYNIDILEREIQQLEETLKRKSKRYVLFKSLKSSNIFRLNHNIFDVVQGSDIIQIDNDISVGPFSSKENWQDYIQALQYAFPLRKRFSRHDDSKTEMLPIREFNVSSRINNVLLKSRIIAVVVAGAYLVNSIFFTSGPSETVFGIIMGILRTVAIGLLAYNVSMMLLRYWTFIVCANRYMNAYVKLDFENIISDYENKKQTLNLKRELLEAAKVTRMRPESIFSNVKRTTANEMRQEVTELRGLVEQEKFSQFRTELIEILNKCDELLNHCGTDSKALSDISSIYNIYLKEVFETIEKYEGTRKDSLREMLMNFNTYLGSKLSKYAALADLAFQSDINTLNSIFTGEAAEEKVK